MTSQKPGLQVLPTLTQDQERKVSDLLLAVSPELEANPPLKSWCTQSTLARFLQARDWNASQAEQKLRGTLEWRRTYRPDAITWADIEPEAVTGKQFRLPVKDKEGRAVLLMRPRNENTKGAERQLKYLVYNLEAACRAADEAGVGKMTWLIDFEGYSYRNAPPVTLALKTLNILQGHYPERLGLSVCYHPPRLFQITWKATKPFIDPVTHKKIVFIDHQDTTSMPQHFHMESIEQCMGGSLTSEQAFNLQSYKAEMEAEDARRLEAAGRM
ncbi:hypothetical protein ABBQ38_013843 [Trebouxia sp. C0009 RCD-2024]